MNTRDENLIQEVLQVEREWVQSLQSLNLEAMAQILDDDYTQITDNGALIGKQEFLASFYGDQRKWEIAESTDHDIRIYDNTAIMIAIWRGKGENHGYPFDYRARFLAVFVKNNGHWQLVADQSTEIK